MITLEEVIEVPRSVEECFHYVADFRTTVEWDATAVEAIKETPGPVSVDTRFALKCKSGPTKLALNYTITELVPFHSISLRGEGRFFTVDDIITFDDLGNGQTRICYIAKFRFRYGMNALAEQAARGFQAMGRASLRGLKKALTDDNPAPSASPATVRRDKKLPTALLDFTRFGYQRGRRRWSPMSTSLAGKHIVLTGANSGLGLATARALLEARAILTAVIRDPNKIDAMQAELTKETGRAADSVELCDMSLLSDVDALCDRLLAKGESIDVLINNAGALFNDYAETREGIERSAALLLLAPWRMTEQLLPLLENHNSAARVINVVSGGMYTQKLRCAQLVMTEQDYNGSVAYARAKRALTVLTEQWAEDWQARNVVVNSMHPGWADTPGVQSALPGFRRITQSVLRSSDEGADTIVWLARAKEADQVTGKLFLDREPRTTHLRSSTIEKEEERARLPDWLEETYASLDLITNA